MAITGITFDNQTVTPKYDGRLYEHLLMDGILSGCVLTRSGNTLYLSEGYLLIAGRLARLMNTESIQTAPAYANGYGRLKLVMDLGNPSTTAAFEQLFFEMEYAPENSFPELVQEDVNGTGTKYEQAVAILQYSGGYIASVSMVLPDCSIRGAAAENHTHPYIPLTEKGASSGVATLDADSRVTAGQAAAKHVMTDGSTLTVSASEAGKTILADRNCTITLGAAPDDTEVEIWNRGSYSVTLSGSLFISGEGSASSCTVDENSACCCKYMSGVWYIAGGVSI